MRARSFSTLLFMGRVFAEPWGGVRELCETLLRALAPLVGDQQRDIEVLVPRAGISPVNSGRVREVVLPQFGASRFAWDHWTVRRHANARGPGAVLYNPKLVLPLGLRVSGFVSIYDLMYFPQPNRYDWREYRHGDSLYMRRMIRSTVARAARIHLSSNHSLADARSLFPDVPESRLSVVYPGVDATFWGEPADPGETASLESWLSSVGVKGRFIMYAGGVSRRKNLSTLLRAFLKFRAAHEDIQLVLTGGDKPTMRDPNWLPLRAAAPPGSVVQLGLISRARLRFLYQRAFFSVFPSFYEGFGFPPAESQAAGCPVIASSASSIPEVVGDAALMFDPRDQAELESRMSMMLDPAVRARLIEAGRRNVARFDPAIMAREILRLADESACA